MGVILAETEGSAKSIIEAFSAANVNIMVQEFIREANGSDIRAFVIGGEVVAATKRIGRPGEFRANLHRGGTAVKRRAHRRGAADRRRARPPRSASTSAASTWCAPAAAPSSWRSTPRPAWKASKARPGSTSPSQIIGFLEQNASYGKTETKGVG